MISRRGLLMASAGVLACGRRKATAYPGYCFVANRQGRNVAVVDLSRFRVRKQIGLDAAPVAVIAHPKKPIAYALAPANGTLYELDAATLAVSRRMRAGSTAVEMRLAPDGKALWILYRDPPALVEAPLDSLKATRRIRLNSAAAGFDLSVDGRAAAACRQDKTIVLAQLDAGRVERTIAWDAAPEFVRFRTDGKLLLAADAAGRSITFFEVASGKTLVRLPLPFEPRRYAITPDGGQVFLDGPGMDAVAIVFPFSTEVWQTVLAGRAPGAMAATDTPPFLLVANPETNSMTVLDLATQNLSAVVEVGAGPGAILTTPDNQYALVLNELSGDMAVIRLDRLSASSSDRVLRFKSASLFTMIPVGDTPVSAAVVKW
ncbi:MAG: YncE family protein [Bryobacteraceae bacterium]